MVVGRRLSVVRRKKNKVGALARIFAEHVEYIKDGARELSATINQFRVYRITEGRKILSVTFKK